MAALVNPSLYSVVGGGGGVPTSSLSFSGASQYLTLSNANWGSYDRAKFAIAGSLYIDAFSGSDYYLFSRDDLSTNREFRLTPRSTGALRFLSFDAGSGQFDSATSLISAGQWYAYLLHYDSANATSTDRIKLWVNGSAITPASYTAPTAAVPTTTVVTALGARFNGLNPLDGLVYQPTFFSGVLPDPSTVFDGTAGKLLDLSELPGAFSLLDASSATNDAILTAEWTDNNSVSTSSSVP